MARPAAGARRRTADARRRRRARRSRRRPRASRRRGRALEVAAAGGHHLLLVGPPGTGKTMLARRLPTILPPLEPTRRSRSRASTPPPVTRPAARLAPRARSARHITRRRPPRSSAAAAGGPRPGEVTLAHRGMLFLDELGEFAPRRARRAAPTARGARGAHLAPGDVARVPCRLPARRVHEPVPVRARRAELPLHRDATGPLPPPPLGAAPRPLRPAPRGRPAPSRATRPGEPSPTVVRGACPRPSRASSARYADRPWRRNAHVPAGALARVVPLARRRRRRVAWLIRTRVLTGPRRGAGAARRPHPRRPRRHAPRSTADPRSAAALCARTCRERAPVDRLPDRADAASRRRRSRASPT